MSERRSDADDRLVTLLATPLRVGTVAAVVLVAVGLALSWAAEPSPASPDGAPLLETILAGGGAGVTSLGLLLLTLVPLAVAIGAVIGFWRAGERRYLVGSAVVALLLIGSLAVSFVLLAPSS